MPFTTIKDEILQMDVSIFYPNDDPELIQNVKIKTNQSGIMISSIIDSLTANGYDFSNYQIYYINNNNYRVNCWYPPIPAGYFIPETEIHNLKTRRIILYVQPKPAEDDSI